MKKPTVLQIGSMTDRFNQRMAETWKAHPLWTEADPAAFLAENGAKFDVVATSARYGCREAQMKLLPNLAAICSFGVGYDAIDVDVAKGRSIQVSNTPNVLNDCVADLAMGLIIDVARRMSQTDRFVREGKWLSGAPPLGTQVFRKKLGIVGLGRIGRAVVQRASGFEMQIGYSDPIRDHRVHYHYEPTAEGLAEWADFLVLTCIGGPATKGLVSRRVLEALGPTGYLINVSRGSVVDEPALVEAVTKGTIAGAALDVYASEPNVPAELIASPNVVVLPHIASGTAETRLAMEELVFQNLAAFAETGEVINRV
ncbi:2-hydroxyacid dehydrogenase [Siculibacillus lacustris]|uniref:2-hydroxyacid dehydrogenase n=1 Tax=Siculibacillus lacustris TaxID=1549641 RepID=A0A4Q9VTS3_9HYPH|nr:2-hydroxyacid dehydrogenase [Siculibacillus lacustris]TBW39019.1 2-hydroxyacid dehydrogenase [Siculibacillus lacustris]